ncbi:MAG: hypothetical protein KIT69_11905, partial [Propionibacteriaceae bacterium]|nr:hypothetical protein [Propionibacteriaceae bacterium]
AGTLRRVRPAVYLAAERWPDDPAEQHLVLAHAELAAHPGAVISHESAAVVWGLPSPRRDWHEQLPTVSLPRTSGDRSRRGLAIYRTAALPPHHVTTDKSGYDVTTVARTAVDLARGEQLPQALLILDAAARLLVAEIVSKPRREHYANSRLTSTAREALAEAAHGRAVGALRQAVALTDPRRESPIESLSAGHFHLAGIPAPEFQHPIRAATGWYYADCYWEDARLIGEADGRGKYRDPDEIFREKGREQELDDRDLRFVRWTGREIWWTPPVVVARVARKLGL